MILLLVGICYSVANEAKSQSAFRHTADCWLEAASDYGVQFTGTQPTVPEIHSELARLAVLYEVPVEVLGAICFQESGMFQYGSDDFIVHNLTECRHAHSTGMINTVRDPPPGLGIMMLTSDTALATGNVERLVADWRFNLEQGVRVLALDKYEAALSFDPPWMQQLARDNRHLLENWFWPIRLYYGHTLSNPEDSRAYVETVFGHIASPSTRLQGLFDPITITVPEDVIPGWTSGSFVALQSGEWLDADQTSYTGTVHTTSLGPIAYNIFIDAFSRPDAGSVGNGWSSFTTGGGLEGPINGSLEIADERATKFTLGGAAGIQRSWPFGSSTTIAATFREASGYNGKRQRFVDSIALRSKGEYGDGYRIFFLRSDVSDGTSEVRLFDDGTLVDQSIASIDYTDEIAVECTFRADGSVIGTITNLSGDWSSFSFPSRAIQSVGSLVQFSVSGPDSRSNGAPFRFPAIDAISISSSHVVVIDPDPSSLNDPPPAEVAVADVAFDAQGAFCISAQVPTLGADWRIQQSTDGANWESLFEFTADAYSFEIRDFAPLEHTRLYRLTDAAE